MTEAQNFDATLRHAAAIIGMEIEAVYESAEVTIPESAEKLSLTDWLKCCEVLGIDGVLLFERHTGPLS